MQFNSSIIFSNSKTFSKLIEYNGLSLLNYMDNLNNDNLYQNLDYEYEVDLISDTNKISNKEIEEAAVFEDRENINNNLIKQFENLKELSIKNKFFLLNKNKTQRSFKLKASVQSDQSSRLLRRLVKATEQFEITQVLSSANRALTTMRMCISMSDNLQQAGNLRAAIKKLEKIINRCEIKSKNLKEEEEIRIRSKKAENNKQADLSKNLIKE